MRIAFPNPSLSRNSNIQALINKHKRKLSPDPIPALVSNKVIRDWIAFVKITVTRAGFCSTCLPQVQEAPFMKKRVLKKPQLEQRLKV